MKLQQLFDDCFDEIFTQSQCSEQEKENLKHSLVQAWIKMTGKRIDSLLSDDEKQKVHALESQVEAVGPMAHAKLEELFMPTVTSFERYNEIIAVLFAEARRLIDQLFSVFCQHATEDQVFRVKERLKKYEGLLHVAA